MTIAATVTHADIERNDWSLSVDRYIARSQTDGVVDMATALGDYAASMRDVLESAHDMEKHLRAAGYDLPLTGGHCPGCRCDDK